MPQQVKKTIIIAIYFALAVGTLLVFWQVRNFDFVNYDDNDYVYENPHVLNGLTTDGIVWAFTASNSAHWHPLTWLSLMLDRQLFGPGPAGFHLINLFFHLANTLLLFAVIKKMTGALWPSAFVAAAFALHPMHVESVAWIAERKDVLSTFFWILTMWAYLQYVKKPGIARYILALLIFALGLMSKPMLVTLPFVLLLLDYWPLERKMSARLLFEKIPFFICSIASSAVTFLVMRTGGTVVDIDIIPFSSRIANVFVSYAEYIGKMFWPRNLAVFYPFNAESISFWQVAVCVLLLLAISVLVIRFGRSHRYLPVGWFWFVGTLIPVIGIIQVGSQAYADRYTYIPYIGLFIIIAWLLPQIFSKLLQRKIILGLSMVIVLTTLGICARRQASFWDNSDVLFSHALAATQNNWLAHNNLGIVYLGLGRYQDAVESYEKAVRINPNYDDAYNSLGVAYGRLGRYQDEIAAYKQAIRIRPDYADAYYNLGIAYDDLGRYQEEIDAYTQAIKINPDYAQAYTNLGITYSRLGRYTEAVDSFKQAVKIKPDYANAHLALGFTYLLSGDKASALAEYEILKTLDIQMANNLFSRINR